jgi:hypothetical protein
MTTEQPKAEEVVETTTVTDNEVEGSMPDIPTKKAEVNSKQMLLNGLLANLEIGILYEFTYQGKVLATADSTKAGAVIINLTPSKWATEVSHNLWEYELDEALSVDPTTVDPLADGWSCVLITDVNEYEYEEEDEEEDDEAEVEEAEKLSDSEAEAEASLEAKE